MARCQRPFEGKLAEAVAHAPQRLFSASVEEGEHSPRLRWQRHALWQVGLGSCVNLIRRPKLIRQLVEFAVAQELFGPSSCSFALLWLHAASRSRGIRDRVLPGWTFRCSKWSRIGAGQRLGTVPVPGRLPDSPQWASRSGCRLTYRHYNI